jgi:hypothetical protein
MLAEMMFACATVAGASFHRAAGAIQAGSLATLAEVL